MDYIESRKAENIRPLVLPNKGKYYLDLLNIEYSWSGRVDAMSIGNTFVMEAEQQLINAIELFELGYFDCAYYSLRSAVDMSTTMVFLIDMPPEQKETFLSNWKETKDFPMQGQMIKQLSGEGNIFADMKAKMPQFFLEAKELNAELNKFVHKQGLQHFYVSRNHLLNAKDNQERFVADFEQYLRLCIRIVAVMRLAIDPFPVLLMDEEILYRCFHSMTEPYREDFVTEYIGMDTLEAYKQTNIYLDTYNSFISEEKKTEAVFNIVKHQYIDSSKMDEIFQQLHLLSKDDVISVLLVYACKKVVKVYCIGGLYVYFTEKKTKRMATSWSSLDFKKFAEAENKINQKYDEAFISAFDFGGKSYFVEHNEPIDDEEIGLMVGLVLGVLFKISDYNEPCEKQGKED